MLNANINYPYPIIREYPGDYMNTFFAGDLSVNLVRDGFEIQPSFNINNDEIQTYINNGQMAYAVEVQCVSTWYRKLFLINNNNKILLNPEFIHDQVELIPCIIAMSYIEDYTNKDFTEEYKDIKFALDPGNIVGIGTQKTFDALYQNDIIKNGSSIVNFDRSDSAKEIVCNFDQSVIHVTLPAEQFDNYVGCGYIKSKYKLLNAILVIPVIVEAIGIIQEDMKNDEDGEYSHKAWYKTIKANLWRYAENEDTKYQKLLETPFASAELLLGNNSSYALDYLNRIE